MSVNKPSGFTIVELLIVIVIIAVLAGLVISTFLGAQQKARDSRRQSDINAIVKALELYYADQGKYPGASGSTTINTYWSTTSDGSWVNLQTALAPYAKNIPSDPISTPGISGLSTAGYNYSYFSNTASGTSYCGAATRQMYILVYRLEGANQVNTLKGDCSTTPLGPYVNMSNYRIAPL